MADKYCGECKHQIPGKLCQHPDIAKKTNKSDLKLYLLATGQPKSTETCIDMRKPKGLCGTAGTLHE